MLPSHATGSEDPIAALPTEVATDTIVGGCRKSKKRSKATVSPRRSKSTSPRRAGSESDVSVDDNLHLAMSKKVVPSGIFCLLCNMSDSSPDPCFKGMTRVWGRPPRVHKKTNVVYNFGVACFYCYKPFIARYYPMYKLANMPALLGGDSKLHLKFFGLAKLTEDAIRASQSLLKISLPSKSELFHESSVNTIWEEPDDIFVPYESYVEEFGDPSTNGLGHSTGHDANNRLCVITPENNCMKRKRTLVETAKCITKMDDGTEELYGSDHLKNKMGNINVMV
jgi:hypothetical protein